jgi:hypothetical protein
MPWQAVQLFLFKTDLTSMVDFTGAAALTVADCEVGDATTAAGVAAAEATDVNITKGAKFAGLVVSIPRTGPIGRF